ncbi:hypothetical protein MPL3356_110137 [Mesorhizobium plurifarium]|uniref:Uncharacterized protein n=1 Tax=Mesorhizobium plurifarium TaxID=69974 RepID=A0A090EXD4_MESPL|nr:hypothetical protein MPL3356_110137 [Mesorhizobium plurifarium]
MASSVDLTCPQPDMISSLRPRALAAKPKSRNSLIISECYTLLPNVSFCDASTGRHGRTVQVGAPLMLLRLARARFPLLRSGGSVCLQLSGPTGRMKACSSHLACSTCWPEPMPIATKIMSGLTSSTTTFRNLAAAICDTHHLCILFPVHRNNALCRLAFASDAMAAGERSFTEWGIQHWPVKLAISVGAALLLPQGLSRLIRDIATDQKIQLILDCRWPSAPAALPCSSSFCSAIRPGRTCCRRGPSRS